MQKYDIVTAVELQVHNKNRYSIFVDDEYFGSVDCLTWKKHGINIGETLSDTLWQELQTLHEGRAALDKAFDIISRRAVTSHEMTCKLKDKGFAQQAIDYALDKMNAYGYINDDNYAVTYTQEKMRAGVGRAYIKHTLRQKGVDAEIVDEALSEYSPEDELQAAHVLYTTLLNRYRHVDDVQKRMKNICDNMYRKGFGWDIINQVKSMDTDYNETETEYDI